MAPLMSQGIVNDSALVAARQTHPSKIPASSGRNLVRMEAADVGATERSIRDPVPNFPSLCRIFAIEPSKGADL